MMKFLREWKKYVLVVIACLVFLFHGIDIMQFFMSAKRVWVKVYEYLILATHKHNRENTLFKH